MAVLDKIKLGHSPLSDTIYLYRHGEDPRVALERREAEADVMKVLVEHMLDNYPSGSKKVVLIGDNKYEVSVLPLPKELKEED